MDNPQPSPKLSSLLSMDAVQRLNGSGLTGFHSLACVTRGKVVVLSHKMSSCRANMEEYRAIIQNRDFQLLAAAKLNAMRRVSRRNQTECFLGGKAGNKKNGKGYASCKLSHHTISRKKVEFYLHRLAYMERTNWTTVVEDNMEVSHLCHNTKCLNMHHLRVETVEEHDLRDTCKGKQVVTMECRCCNKRRTHNPCTHMPACILEHVSLQFDEEPV
jgi:hypothetical protein